MPSVKYNGEEYKIKDNYLDLKSQDIEDITLIEGLENLTELKALNLRNNRITEIKGLDDLQNLERLYLDGNQITEIKGLETLQKLEGLQLDGNQMEDPEEEYLIQKLSHAQDFVEYCKLKKIGQYIPFIKVNKKISLEKNIDAFKKKHIEITDISFFVNIGTHKESKQIKGEQNAVFFMEKPNEITLSAREISNYKDIVIHLVQLHSLKGIEFLKKKLEHFNFFTKHFWDNIEIEKNQVLIYNEEYESRVSKKIDEMLDLSLNTKPDIIVFPENSIPQNKIKYLENYSKTNNLIIIGGLEHVKENDEHVNKTIIIDKGKRSEQKKQTPVWIWNKEKKEYQEENIECQHLPEINIFNTSLGRMAIFICKDFLRLSEIVPYWVKRYQVDFVIIPSLTTKVLPFQARLLSILNYPQCKNTKFIFNNIGAYGGSELFSIEDNWRIEENYRLNNHDNIGETIVIRKIKRIKSRYLELVSKEMEKCKNDPEKIKKLQNYKKNIELDHIPYSFTKNLSIKWLDSNPHFTEKSMIEITERFGKKLEGYCIRCREEIPLDPNKPYCYEDWEVWSRWDNPFYVERYCHKCGKPYSATKIKPLCDDCYRKYFF